MVRRRWRSFRWKCRDAALLPVWGPDAKTDYPAGFAIYGQVEAIQGDDTLWITTDAGSIQVIMNGHPVYSIDDAGIDANGNQAHRTPEMTRWEHVGPLPEGSRIFVAGDICYERAGLVVRAWKSAAPLLVFYDGPAEDLIARLLWAGRQRNEFWNAFTPMSLMIGFGLLAIFGFSAVRESGNRFWAVLAASLSVIPFAALLPPGILGFFLYRRLWRKGRHYRGFRDLSILVQSLLMAGETNIDKLHNAQTVICPPGTFKNSQWNVFAFAKKGLAFPLRLPMQLDVWERSCKYRAILLETVAIIIFLLSLVVNWFEILILMAQIVAMR